jgi:hypothetical protein
LYGGVRRQFQTAHGEQIPSVKIIHKYVLREHAGPLVFALSALTSLLLLNYIAKQFGNLVGKGLPWAVIGQFFGLSVPFTLAMTLPMAVLVSRRMVVSRRTLVVSRRTVVSRRVVESRRAFVVS